MKRYEGWGDGERFWIGPDGKPINYSPYELIMGSGGGGGGIDQTRQSFTTATTAVVGCGDPLVLDLDGDGIETTLVADGAYFDHDGNGFAEQTGWASSDDGLLAWDRNGDEIINDGKELFNDLVSFPNATNGFQVLAQLDDNQDGKIDVNDAIWNQLKIWQDYDGDGMINGKWEVRNGKSYDCVGCL